MTTSFQKICIYGAGAIGGWIGAGLAASGLPVSVVARGATLSALRLHGLRISRSAVGGATGSSAGLTQSSYPVLATDQPAELGVQDLVVIAVKAPALLEVARHIGPLIGPETVVMTAMNGVPWWFLQGFGGALQGAQLKSVDSTGEIGQAIPASQIIGCVVHASCSLLSPAHVQQHSGNGLILGEPSGLATPRVLALQQVLSQSGFNATVSAQIQTDCWYKLWGNMTLNPISAFTGATTDLILGDPLVREFVSGVMLEAKGIGQHLGIRIEQQPQDRHAVTLKLGAFKTSMLQDVEAGRAVELDALVSVVCELGQLTGVATPLTNTLLGLARVHAQVHGLYPRPA